MTNNSFRGASQTKQTSQRQASSGKEASKYDSKKRSSRPMSGGLSKLLKSDAQKSRITKVNANYSMYDQMGNANGSNGFSPEKNFGSKASDPNKSNERQSVQ